MIGWPAKCFEHFLIVGLPPTADVNSAVADAITAQSAKQVSLTFPCAQCLLNSFDNISFGSLAHMSLWYIAIYAWKLHVTFMLATLLQQSHAVDDVGTNDSDKLFEGCQPCHPVTEWPPHAPQEGIIRCVWTYLLHHILHARWQALPPES